MDVRGLRGLVRCPYSLSGKPMEAWCLLVIFFEIQNSLQISGRGPAEELASPGEQRRVWVHGCEFHQQGQFHGGLTGVIVSPWLREEVEEKHEWHAIC